MSNYGIRQTHKTSGKVIISLVETNKEVGFEKVTYSDDGFSNFSVMKLKKDATKEVKKLKKLYKNNK